MPVIPKTTFFNNKIRREVETQCFLFTSSVIYNPHHEGSWRKCSGGKSLLSRDESQFRKIPGKSSIFLSFSWLLPGHPLPVTSINNGRKRYVFPRFPELSALWSVTVTLLDDFEVKLVYPGTPLSPLFRHSPPPSPPWSKLSSSSPSQLTFVVFRRIYDPW